MASMTGWKFLVNFLLPPPLLLTLLLVVPFPRNVRKGILLFTNQVLSFSVVGGMKLVHFSLILSGIPFLDSGMRTFRSSQAAHDDSLTPNMKAGLLAKKWREERNFWIAAMAFTVWLLLTVLYATVDALVRAEEELEAARAEMDDLKGIRRPPPTTNRMRIAGTAVSLARRLGLGVPARLADEAAGADAPEAALSRGGAASSQENLAEEETTAGSLGGDTPARNLRSRARAPAAAVAPDVS